MATLSAAISAATTKSLLSKLPAEASTKFNLDETEFKEFLQAFLTSQLGKATKGGRAAGPKGTNGKGRISGYILFSNENRESVKEANEGLKFTEVGKELGKMWGNLSDDEKAEWNNRAIEKNVANGLPAQTPAAKKDTPKKGASKKAAAKKAPAKKTAAKKVAGESDTGVTVSRHQASKSWVIQGTEFAVQSPKNKAVIGKLRANKVVPLTPADRKKVEGKGLQVAEATAKESTKKAPAKKAPAKKPAASESGSDDSDSS